MSKSRPKSQAKSRNRRPAAKTVKELKSLSHFCREFFLLLLSLWKLGRKLFGESFGLSGKKKEPLLSLERPDDTSAAALAAFYGVSGAAKRASEEQTEELASEMFSPAALASFCGASGAAKRASEEQTEELASEMFSPGTVTDKDPSDDPKSTGHSTEALDLEVVGAVFSSEHNGVMVGGHFCPYQAGYRHSYEEHAKLHFLERLHVNEDDEIKSERPRSDSGYWKKVFDNTLILRQAYSDFEKRKEFEVMNTEITEEVLKLLRQETGKNRKFMKVVRKTLYTKILRTMHFQKGNMALKSSFESIEWRKDNRFPTFCNYGPEYKWWEKNYVPEILEKRLEILREAAKKWNSEQDIFMVIELVTDLNSTLHPQTSGMGTVEMFRLATTIYSACWWGLEDLTGVVAEDKICMPLTLSGIWDRSLHFQKLAAGCWTPGAEGKRLEPVL